MRVKSLFFIPLFLFLVGCANMLAPTGGPTDSTPPIAKKTEPLNNQRNYTNSFIKLTFDEYVALDNINNELIVSPPLKYKVESKIKGKTAIISWKDTLAENTTYTFNFGNGIKDINEGNILENYTITFSTGEDIDSAKFSATIKQIDKSEPLKGAFVYLTEKQLDDSSFFPIKAQYQTKTNSQGKFTFQGLKPSNYNLFFLEDKNGNKTADNGEYAGFSDSMISIEYPKIKEQNDTAQIQDEISEDVFYAFPYHVENKRIFKSFNPDNSQFIAAIWQENVFNENVSAFIDSNELYSFISKDTLWIFAPQKDTFRVEIKNVNRETIFLSDSIKMLAKPEKLLLKPQSKKLSEDFDSVYIIQINQVISAIDTSKFQLKYDSLKITPRATFDEHNIYIWHQFEEDKSYEIKLADSAFQYMDSLFNKKTKAIKFNLPEKKSLSNYEIKLVRTNTDFQSIPLIIKIEFEGSNFYKYLTSQDSLLTLSNIKSGSYKLTVYGDKNDNGIWDTGDIQQYKQAEPIYEIPQAIEVKEGWDGDAEVEL